jgi:rhodanese-related sulfurtransferase
VLVDIRGADEHRRSRIAGARCLPLDALDASALATCAGDAPVVFHCRSGLRTTANSVRLANAAQGRQAYCLAGGLNAWRQSGLAVEHTAGAPLELARQVQLAVGTVVLAGSVLAATVSPWFLLLAALPGLGLMIAGLTGFCGLAHVLARMPWNRVRHAPT